MATKFKSAQAEQQARHERGHALAADNRVFRFSCGTRWTVLGDVGKVYEVTKQINGLSPFACTCEDFRRRGLQCKHGYAVQSHEARPHVATTAPKAALVVTEEQYQDAVALLYGAV